MLIELRVPVSRFHYGVRSVPVTLFLGTGYRIERRYHNSLSWAGALAARSFLRCFQQRLNMSLKTDLVAMQFFSYTNRVSLSTRTALGVVVNKGLPEINLKVREVDYDNEKEVCRQYGVYGVPMTLVFWNDKLIGRHYGEITSEEFEAIFKYYREFKGDYREGLEE